MIPADPQAVAVHAFGGLELRTFVQQPAEIQARGDMRRIQRQRPLVRRTRPRIVFALGRDAATEPVVCVGRPLGLVARKQLQLAVGDADFELQDVLAGIGSPPRTALGDDDAVAYG